jgi:hypothetical protein
MVGRIIFPPAAVWAARCLGIELATLHSSPIDYQNASRSNKFWTGSRPPSIDDRGVRLLFGSWVQFWLSDGQANRVGKSIDRSRATFAQTLGCEADKGAFDLYWTRALGRAAESEPDFAGRRLSGEVPSIRGTSHRTRKFGTTTPRRPT